MEQVISDFPWLVGAPLPELVDDRAPALAAVLEQYATWQQPEYEYNFPVRSPLPFFTTLYDRFVEACESYFEPFTVHPHSSRRCWAYVQNRDRHAPVWHDHLASCTINGVYYLRVPDPTGELWLRRLERVYRVRPEEGWLYLFPRWLEHKPAPQQALEHRVSLNIELITREYPIVRATQLRW